MLRLCLLVVLHFYEGSDISGNYDIRIPLVMNIYDYMDMAFLDQRYMLFYDKMQKNLGITPPSDFRIKVLGVDLKIDGQINISGKVIFEDKDLIGVNQAQNKSWDLDIEQTQRFNIEGTIGDRWTIKAHQDTNLGRTPMEPGKSHTHPQTQPKHYQGTGKPQTQTKT